MTPTEITAIAGGAVLIINAVFTGLAHLWSIKYTDKRIAESSAGGPSSSPGPRS